MCDGYLGVVGVYQGTKLQEGSLVADRSVVLFPIRLRRKSRSASFVPAYNPSSLSANGPVGIGFGHAEPQAGCLIRRRDTLVLRESGGDAQRPSKHRPIDFSVESVQWYIGPQPSQSPSLRARKTLSISSWPVIKSS